MIRQSTPEQLIDFEPNVSDPRIKPLLFRYRARNFPHTLNETEQLKWQSHLQDYFQIRGETKKIFRGRTPK